MPTTTQNDNKIVQLKKIVAQKRKELGDEPKFRPITTCQFKIDLTFNTNIHALNSVQSLNNALMYLGLYELAAEKAGLSADEVQINGFSISDWKKDIESKKSLIEYQTKKQELSNLEGKLDGMLSEAQKTAISLDEIAELLGN
jgi:hypothetical protein